MAGPRLEQDAPLMRALEGLAALGETLALMECHGVACAFCRKTRAYGHCLGCPLSKARRQLAGLEQTLMEVS